MRTNGKCQCNEGFLQRSGTNENTGEKIPEIRAPLVHDCEYVRQREALIPAAIELASTRPASLHPARAFHEAMDRLWHAMREKAEV